MGMRPATLEEEEQTPCFQTLRLRKLGEYGDRLSLRFSHHS